MLRAMDLTLDPGQLELQARARAYVRDVLQPLEEEFERADGRLSRKQGSDLRRGGDRGPAPRRQLPRRGSAARAGRPWSRSSSTSSSAR